MSLHEEVGKHCGQVVKVLVECCGVIGTALHGHCKEIETVLRKCGEGIGKCCEEIGNVARLCYEGMKNEGMKKIP